MIDTKELTIGCHVKVNGKPYKVDEVFANAVGLEKLDTLFHESELEPIPITRDFLLKNGFVDDERLEYGKKTDKYELMLIHYIGDLHNGWVIRVKNCDKRTSGDCDIQYVHQIQTFCNLLGIKLDFEIWK